MNVIVILLLLNLTVWKFVCAICGPANCKKQKTRVALLLSYIEHSYEVPIEEVRSPRQRRLIRAQMADSFGASYDIVIRNVSDKGVGATMQGVPPLKGSAVKFIIVHGMAMDGTIRWVQGRSFGIALDKPIDLQTLTEVIQRKQQSASQEGHWEVSRSHQVHSHHVEPDKLRKI